MQIAPGRTVLIVDDREDVAATLAELVRACGFAAEVAEPGTDLLTLLERYQPAGVVLDVMMPEQDGYEALKDVARFDLALPVLLVTGHGDSWLQMGKTLGRAQGLTALRVAGKPVRLQTMRDFLSAVPEQ